MFDDKLDPRLVSARAALRRSLRLPLIGAGIVALGFFGVLGTWSATVPLASAALAPGTISPEGHRRTVQHLEGGIIDRILVEDGDMVATGQPLLTLKETQARASFRIHETQYLALKAMELRLVAETEGAPDVAWEMMPQRPGWEEAVADQQSVFKAGRNALETQREILRQRISQLEEEIAGLHQQIESALRQLSLIDQQILDLQSLVDKGLGRRPQLLELQRERATIEGRHAASQSSIARARQSIGETRLQILSLETERRDAAAQKLGEVRARIADIEERMTGSKDVLERTVVTAPVSGTVFNLRYATAGGVIGPGEPILEIVPQEEDLLVDVRVSPNDIDVVTQGLEAEIKLTAYAQRNLPRLNGTVRTVSADRFTDEQTGEVYYTARIEIDPQGLAELGDRVELLPGMSADAMIFTGTRTFFGYLFDPLVESIDRSFREK